MVTSPYVEVITATPEPYAMAVVWSRFKKQRQEEEWGSEKKWGSKEERIAYHVFFIVVDGRVNRRDHRSIGKMSGCTEEEARRALNFLERSQLITLKVHRKEREEMTENALDTALLKQDFDVMKDDGPAITRYFYDDFSQRGRDTFFTDEIADLFSRTDWQRQYAAFWGSLAGIMTAVLSGADIAAYLHDLGRKHSLDYHVLPGYYGLAGQSLIETFRWYHVDYRRIAWTQELQNAWVTAYTLVSGIMLSTQNTPETGPL